MSKYKNPPVKPYTPAEDPRAADEATLFKPQMLDIGAEIGMEPLSQDKPHPHVTSEDKFVSIAALASEGRPALVEAMRKHMANKPAEYVAPAPTERQRTRTELEMEAGRRASERHRLSALAALQPKPDPSDGYTVPVFRPADHVPNFDSKDPGARTLK